MRGRAYNGWVDIVCCDRRNDTSPEIFVVNGWMYIR